MDSLSGTKWAIYKLDFDKLIIQRTFKVKITRSNNMIIVVRMREWLKFRLYFKMIVCIVPTPANATESLPFNKLIHLYLNKEISIELRLNYTNLTI